MTLDVLADAEEAERLGQVERDGEPREVYRDPGFLTCLLLPSPDPDAQAHPVPVWVWLGEIRRIRRGIVPSFWATTTAAQQPKARVEARWQQHGFDGPAGLATSVEFDEFGAKVDAPTDTTVNDGEEVIVIVSG